MFKEKYWISPLRQDMFKHVKVFFSETIVDEIIVKSQYENCPASDAAAPGGPGVMMILLRTLN